MSMNETVNVFWDAGQKGAIVSDYQINPRFKAFKLNFGKYYYLDYADISKISSGRKNRVNVNKIVIHCYENIGINRVTSAVLNRQIAYLVWWLSKVFLIKNLEIMAYNESTVYHFLIKDAQANDDRTTKKSKTLARFANLTSEHVADALMLLEYFLLKGVLK